MANYYEDENGIGYNVEHFTALVLFGSDINGRQSYGVLITDGDAGKIALASYEEEGFVECLLCSTESGNIDNQPPATGATTVCAEMHYPSNWDFKNALHDDLVEFKNIQWGEQ